MPRTNKTSEAKVQAIFDRISTTYDATNSAISLGMHKRWRKKTMAQLPLESSGTALDLCCGTGDWTIDLAQVVGPTGKVVGLDFSKNMLEIAKKKAEQADVAQQTSLIQEDAMALPFVNNSFDVVTIGFGLRNVPDASRVLSEMQRVVKPGGMVACLETSQPQNKLIYPFWNLYFKIVPLIAKMKHNDTKDYVYLQKTTKEFFNAKELEKLFQSVGLTDTTYQTFLFGAAALHTGSKNS
ncbi:demethylmenaquinone methyltransferase [Tetragenococcus koreensis]|uniref:Demethylmenaquinone methyltransferase n=1 Tax=Tetragenococcus koreensis TaxID=290335 RepID=A0AAN4RK50_9ENTE|nr:demethylmenaquinone methyltransferase [Tetragenococcus koreensis]AYW45679.1 bifunctional demethylmenaquinone methyltransferase/2-methoxy-6-polyprenyl-1,4-benzoquinol methylase [Tetragenococcus koreensis]MCF1584850.1 demethylmenaquinone methyltransferase [Tetragenococcus koreensis]MCF1614402.1 demethylmenaquinone methyltransferase [Tetragenococcus koreensis]MCF1617010.1 demethylmenaquinone methyltransferase [Tetragenococcus koreensis]MCF1619896.1 demethylmenaquinone methyltransferase [Tetrag